MHWGQIPTFALNKLVKIRYFLVLAQNLSLEMRYSKSFKNDYFLHLMTQLLGIHNFFQNHVKKIKNLVLGSVETEPVWEKQAKAFSSGASFEQEFFECSKIPSKTRVSTVIISSSNFEHFWPNQGSKKINSSKTQCFAKI